MLKTFTGTAKCDVGIFESQLLGATIKVGQTIKLVEFRAWPSALPSKDFLMVAEGQWKKAIVNRSGFELIELDNTKQEIEGPEYCPVKIGRGKVIHAAVLITHKDGNYLRAFCGTDRRTTGQWWPSPVNSMRGYKVTCKRCLKSMAGHPGAAEALRIEIDNASE